MKVNKKNLQNYFVSFILAFFLFFPLAHGEIVVINSKDWKDIYYGILYANYNNYPVYFTNSPNPAGLFNILPKQPVILIESQEKYIPNLETQMRLKGYNIVEKITIKNSYKELKPKNIDAYYVIAEDFPYLSLPVGALAMANNAWVLIVNENNLNDVANMLSNAKYVIAVGDFKRSIENALSQYFTKRINADSKFEISIKLAEEFLKVKRVSQVIITEGKYIEPTMLEGYSPVLLVGTNLLPKEVLEFLTSNNIKTVIAIGPQLTYVGEKIRQQTNKKVAVFIKFGQSTPGISPQIYALSMFPLPKPELKLTILEAIYNPETQKLMIHFANQGNTGLYEFTTFRILRNGEEIASGGDTEAVFIGSGESIWRSYDIKLTDLTGELIIEFYTSYGESPRNLDSYLTQQGKFGPPFSLPLKISEIKDNSQIEVLEIKYYKSSKRFGIRVKNTGNVSAFVIIKLLDVKIKGIPTSLSSKAVELKPGEIKEIFIPAELDEIDIQENSQVKIEADYGERKHAIVKSSMLLLPLETASEFPLMLVLSLVIIAAAVIIVIRSTKSKPYKYTYKSYKRYKR